MSSQKVANIIDIQQKVDQVGPKIDTSSAKIHQAGSRLLTNQGQQGQEGLPFLHTALRHPAHTIRLTFFGSRLAFWAAVGLLSGLWPTVAATPSC